MEPRTKRVVGCRAISPSLATEKSVLGLFIRQSLNESVYRQEFFFFFKVGQSSLKLIAHIHVVGFN